MPTCVPVLAARLVEAHAGDLAVEVRLELDADLDGAAARCWSTVHGVTLGPAIMHGQPTSTLMLGRRARCCRCRRWPETLIVDGRRPVGVPAVGPRRCAGGRVPARAAVGGDLDPGDLPPPLSLAVPEMVTVRPSSTAAPCAGLVIVDVGRRRVASTQGVGDEAGHERRRLRAHVGEQVDGRLLHDGVWVAPGGTPLTPQALVVSRPHAHCTVPAPKTMAPLDGPVPR